MRRTLLYPVGCQNTSLEVVPRPIPGVCWVEFHPLPAELLSASVWSTSGATQTLKVFRRASHCPTAEKDSPICWGHMNPSDQSIPCTSGWLSNAFLLQQQGHFPSALLGTSVSMVQHKASPSMRFYISELSVCEQDGDCSF